MRIENTREYTKAGEFICIKNSKNQTLLRFYFADYKTDEECTSYANKILNLLKLSREVITQ